MAAVVLFLILAIICAFLTILIVVLAGKHEISVEWAFSHLFCFGSTKKV